MSNARSRRCSLDVRVGTGDINRRALFKNTHDVAKKLDAHVLSQAVDLSQPLHGVEHAREDEKVRQNKRAEACTVLPRSKKIKSTDRFPFEVPDISPIAKIEPICTEVAVNAVPVILGTDGLIRNSSAEKPLLRKATPRRRRRKNSANVKGNADIAIKISSTLINQNCAPKNADDELGQQEDSIICSRSFQEICARLDHSPSTDIPDNVLATALSKQVPPELSSQVDVKIQTPVTTKEYADLSILFDNKTLDSLLLSNDIDLLNAAATPGFKGTQAAAQNTFYGLPKEVKQLLKNHRGINTLYDWQDQCLRLDAIEKRQNLIYSLPTSGGKTLVAEVLMLREVLLFKRDALLILPYVSIVQEKVRGLSPFAVDLNFHVEEYAASRGTMPPRQRRNKNSIYIATIEKANNIINSLIGQKRTSELGIIVVDELHMIGDGSSRGATLEVCLTKAIYSFNNTQIVGMSATLGNIQDLQRFLSAEVYTNDFRPVELTEYVKVNDKIYKVINGKVKEEIPCVFERRVTHLQDLSKSLSKQDPDHISSLVSEVIPQHSCLIFCPTKKNCENVALLLVKCLPSGLKDVNSKERSDVLNALGNAVNVVCPVLKKTIAYGIAYHHSGLTLDERKIIEDAYSGGTLCLLCCTSTLAAGVNLPARRVILRAPYIAREFLTRSRYRQMVGRAGRAGIDSCGESILIIEPKDRPKVLDLVSGPCDSCLSSLAHHDNKGIRSLVLSLLGLQICATTAEVVEFFKSTLLHIQMPVEDASCVSGVVASAVSQLVSLSLVAEEITADQPTNGVVTVTDLGRAAFIGCLDADTVPCICSELRRSLRGLVLLTDLHLLYLVTPLDFSGSVAVNWRVYYKEMCRMTDSELAVMAAIGVPESFVGKKATGQRSSKLDVEMYVVNRLYVALMLYRLVKGISVWQVANDFDITRGFLQSLLTGASSFACLLLNFTKELAEFSYFVPLLEVVIKRISNTASAELLPLMEIPGVKQARARQLYKAGYHTLQSIAWTTADQLMQMIHLLSKRQATLIVASAKMLVQERIEVLNDAAKELMKDTTGQQQGSTTRTIH